MPTKLKTWSSLLWLVLFPILSILLEHYLNNAAIWRYVAVSLPWLVTGAVFKSVATNDLPEDVKDATERLGIRAVLFVIFLMVLWLLSFLKLSDYGIAINLLKSPVSIWMGAAFILGFYRKLLPKSFVAVVSGLKESFIKKTGLEFPKNENLKFAEVWKGLKIMFKDLTRHS